MRRWADRYTAHKPPPCIPRMNTAELSAEALADLLHAVRQVVTRAAGLARSLPGLQVTRKEDGSPVSTVDRQGLKVRRKEDGSPVSEIDRAVHDLLEQSLGNLEPKFPVLSEEGIIPPFRIRRDWRRYWLVDPIDGTLELIRGSPQFTVNVALIENHVPVLGVIHVPCTDHCYYAARGMGAFRRDGNRQATAIRSAKTDTPVLRVICSRSRRNRRMDGFLKSLDRNFVLERVGSSLKACRVAEDAADLYPQFGRTYEWDTAASQCIVEQAGGRLTDLQSRPLRYNEEESLENPPFLVTAYDNLRWCEQLRRLV